MNKPDAFDCWRLPDDGSIEKCARLPPPPPPLPTAARDHHDAIHLMLVNSRPRVATAALPRGAAHRAAHCASLSPPPTAVAGPATAPARSPPPPC